MVFLLFSKIRKTGRFIDKRTYLRKEIKYISFIRICKLRYSIDRCKKLKKAAKTPEPSRRNIDKNPEKCYTKGNPNIEFGFPTFS